MSQRATWLSLPLFILALAPCGSCAFRPKEHGQRIEFSSEVQNLRFRQSRLETAAPPEFVLCPGLTGAVRYGMLPHRLIGEPVKSVDHFIYFAVVYPAEGAPSLVVDLNRNHRFECDEIAPTLTDPREADHYFRTVAIAWNGSDGGPERARRYRVIVPGHLVNDNFDGYALEMVDVPVARLTVNGVTALLVQFDGNHNGVFDRTFGDGLLVDPTGEGRFDLDLYDGDSFFPYAFPIKLPWGLYQIRELDPRGESIEVAALDAEDARAYARFELGDSVPPLECHARDGERITLAGARSGYQLIYFWLSSCGSCQEDMDKLVPYLAGLRPGVLSPVGVSLDEAAADFDKFVAEHAVSWPQCHSGRMFWDHPIARRFGVDFPSDFVIIDPTGHLVAKGLGIDDLRRAVADLGLATPSS